MSEISSLNRPPDKPEAQPTSAGVGRRSLLKGIGGLLFAGGVGGGLLASKPFRADHDQRLPGELSAGDYKRLEEAGNVAKKRAEELQTRINATVRTNEPVDITVLDEIYLSEKVGDSAWKIYKPILLGDPPKTSEVDKGFWFGIQFPEPGGSSRPPSVGIRAMLFDRSRMSLSYFVPEDKDTIAAQQMQVLVMSPEPNMPSSNMVAYAYNEFAPDHRQRRHNDSTQLIAPGLQIPVD